MYWPRWPPSSAAANWGRWALSASAAAADAPRRDGRRARLRWAPCPLLLLALATSLYLLRRLNLPSFTHTFRTLLLRAAHVLLLPALGTPLATDR